MYTVFPTLLELGCKRCQNYPKKPLSYWLLPIWLLWTLPHFLHLTVSLAEHTGNSYLTISLVYSLWKNKAKAQIIQVICLHFITKGDIIPKTHTTTSVVSNLSWISFSFYVSIWIWHFLSIKFCAKCSCVRGAITNIISFYNFNLLVMGFFFFKKSKQVNVWIHLLWKVALDVE